MKKRSLLGTCLLISLSAHLFFLFFFARTPWLLQSRWASIFKKSSSPLEVLTADEENLLRQAELDEVFEEFVAVPKMTPFDFSHQLSEHIKSPTDEKADVASLKEEIFDLEQEKLASTLDSPTLTPDMDPPHEIEPGFYDDEYVSQLEFAKTASADHKKELVSSLSLDEIEPVDDLGIDSLPITALVESDLGSVAVAESFLKKMSPKERDSIASSLLESIELPEEKFDLPALMLPKEIAISPKRDVFSTSLPDIDDYTLPGIATALPWDDAYEVNVEIMPNPEGSGFVFKLNLQPTEEMQLEAMPQNFYFLIDRSSSIPKHRFASFKRAVLKALTCLQEGDKFNVLLFDKKIKRLSERPIPFSKKNYKRAEEFLEKQEHAGVFAAVDLYAALGKIVPKDLLDEEVHSAILITDGDSSLAPAKQHKHISKWIESNQGKVTLYTAAVGRNNNLLLLDLLSTATGGQLIYSDTHAAFPRRLGKLVLNLHGPLVKELAISAEPKNAGTEILFYPASLNMPSLFAKRPYEIVGTASSLSDFTLLIQGKYKDRQVVISKEISLKNAAKGNRILERKWAGANAKSQYGNFIKEGKVAHLLKAKELLKSSGSEIISQK